MRKPDKEDCTTAAAWNRYGPTTSGRAAHAQKSADYDNIITLSSALIWRGFSPF
jgi:hypothetical protein